MPRDQDRPQPPDPLGDLKSLPKKSMQRRKRAPETSSRPDYIKIGPDGRWYTEGYMPRQK